VRLGGGGGGGAHTISPTHPWRDPPPKKKNKTTQVTNGKGAMPAWGGQLSKEEIEGVAAFVFKTASEGGW